MNRGRSTKSRITILIADSEGVFRLGLRKLFSIEDNLRVVAQAETADQLLAMAKSFRPNLAFVQAEMLVPHAAGLMKQVARLNPEIRVIVVVANGRNDAEEYIQSGATATIARGSNPELFVQYARQVMAGERKPSKRDLEVSYSEPALKPQPTRPVDSLTRREKSIISGLTQGWRNREIADSLSISEQTVKNHLRSIFDKVGVSDRLELALYAIHQHLDLPPLSPPASPAH